jgi:hypothetical protein
MAIKLDPGPDQGFHGRGGHIALPDKTESRK